MAHLINFSFDFFYDIFTENASLRLLYHRAKKSKMTKNSNQGGPALKRAEVDEIAGALLKQGKSQRFLDCLPSCSCA